MPFDDRSPHSVDLHVGAKVRMRRKLLGLSQSELADALQITFQQVQKYERGANRISSSKLWEIARALKTSMNYFFDGYAEGETPEGVHEVEAEQFVHTFLMTTEGVELAATFPKIKSANQRRKILELVRSLTDDVADT